MNDQLLMFETLLALLLDGVVTLASRLWLERGLRPS